MRRKKLLTRKQRAVCWGAGAVCLFLWMNLALHIGYLLPVQAFWEMEEQIGAGDLEVVDRHWETGSDFFLSAGWLSLAGNEHVVVLAPERWTYTGWNISGPEVLICDDGAPLHVGIYAVQRSQFAAGVPGPGEDWVPFQTTVYLFGRVDDPDIRSLRMELDANRGDGEPLEVTTDRAEWIVRDDGAYFLLRQEFGGFLITDLQQTTAYDAAGNVVTTVAGGT